MYVHGDRRRNVYWKDWGLGAAVVTVGDPAGDNVFLNLSSSFVLKYGIMSICVRRLGQPPEGVPPGELQERGRRTGLVKKHSTHHCNQKMCSQKHTVFQQFF